MCQAIGALPAATGDSGICEAGQGGYNSLNRALLAEMFDLTERPEVVYEHVWTPGDFVMWDNRCTDHARTGFPAGERRLLRRSIVNADQPFVGLQQTA